MNLIKYCCVISILALVLVINTVSLFAADKTWTGTTDSNWAEASNWNPSGVPTASDNVKIPNTSNDPVIQGDDISVLGINLKENSTLTILEGAKLTVLRYISVIAGCSMYNSGIINIGNFGYENVYIYNEGIIRNSSVLNIGNTRTSGKVGIHNLNTFENLSGGEINIDGVSIGIRMQSGTFINASRINIGGIAEISEDGLHCSGGLFYNNEGGEMTINQTGTRGIWNNAWFTNAAKLNIGQITSVGKKGIVNAGNFKNLLGGEISIDRTIEDGLINYGGFYNSATINIGQTNDIGFSGILNDRVFKNNLGGKINIDRTGRDGINNVSGTFTNSSTINIGQTTEISLSGIINGNTFKNEVGSEINIDQTINDGLSNSFDGIFTNVGKINIGKTAEVGGNGLSNLGRVRNNEGGEINIDRTVGKSINNESGSFTNDPCGIVRTTEKIYNGNTFDNKGFLYSSFEGTHINEDAFYNQGTIEDKHNAFDGITFTNGNLRIIPISNCNSNTISDAIEDNDKETFTVGANWYLDESLTELAGTYNQTSNVFTLDLLLGEYTLYMLVTDNMMACSEVMSINVKGGKPKITGDLEYCASDNTTTLETGHYSSYKWSNGETSQKIEVSEGTYTVTVTNSNGCTGTDEVTVIENENPIPSITGDLEYCTSNNATILDAGNWKNYLWSNEETSQVIEVSEGTYNVIVTNDEGCKGTDEVTVIENENPAPSITGTFDYCRGREATLDAGVWSSYAWSNGETVQFFSTTSIGTYTVTVTNSNDCTGTAMAEITAILCLAEAGILTTNASTICAGEAIEISSTEEQKDDNYLQYSFLYTQDNLGNTIFHQGTETDYETGNASTNFDGLESGNYLVCVYNEYQNCPPNPSPITTNLDDIYQTGTVQDGCFDIECTQINVPETFAPNIEGSGQVTGTNASGHNIFIAEVCGGTAPYSMEFDFTNGFVNVQEHPSENAGCINYQVVYTQGTDWALTITDANNCSNEAVVFSSAGLPSTPLPQILYYSSTPETCIGDLDGIISLEVEGGDATCSDYTYTWSSTNGFGSTVTDEPTGTTLSGLASGFYDVTVTDCAGTTTTQDIYVNRTNSSGGRGRGRSGCKTGGDTMSENNTLFVSPNPFNKQTSIEFSLIETSKVWLSVYSMDGRKVAELLQGETIEGEIWQQKIFEVGSLQSGVYILELQTELGLRQHKQLMVVK